MRGPLKEIDNLNWSTTCSGRKKVQIGLIHSVFIVMICLRQLSGRLTSLKYARGGATSNFSRLHAEMAACETKEPSNENSAANIQLSSSSSQRPTDARKLARKAAKAAAKAAKQAKRNAAPSLKSCCVCEETSMKLFRCQIDESKEWKFVCPSCWPKISCVQKIWLRPLSCDVTR